MNWHQGGTSPLRALWRALQVKNHGSYSVERLRRLESYSKTISIWRVLAFCLLTPIPCLALSIMIESAPLVSPEDGIYANWVFILRHGVITCIMSSSMVYHLGANAPRLTMDNWQIVTIGVLSGAAAALTLFVVAATTAFPVPFTILLATPPSIVVFGVCFACFWGAQFRADPLIKTEIDQQMKVLNCQLGLTLVYPVYILGFTSLTGIKQAVFVVVLPVIKIAAKNWISRALGKQNDLKPEAVTFNVELFNALYISNALQIASSWISTATIMVLDAMHLCHSFLDIMNMLQDVKELMKKIPHDHPLAKDTFMQVALKMIAIDKKIAEDKKRKSTGKNAIVPAEIAAETSKKLSTAKASPVERGPALVDLVETKRKSSRFQQGSRKVLFQESQVVPIPTPQHRDPTRLATRVDNDEAAVFNTIFTRDERAAFIRKCTRVLFISEYLVLVEYVEVVLPLVYSLHHIVLFRLPNNVYYPSLAGISSTKLTSSILGVLGYSTLEFASLIVLIIMLKHTLGFSSMRQLAFVLEFQGGVIQSKLTILFVYIMQISLVHLGTSNVFPITLHICAILIGEFNAIRHRLQLPVCVATYFITKVVANISFNPSIIHVNPG